MPAIVSREEWTKARLAHLASEKELTRLRDQLSAERRALPWVKIDKPYVFATPQGARALADLFSGRSQLVIYHFMLGPDWAHGCPSCSYVCDHLDGALAHLNHRDVTLMAVSRAPLAQIEAFKARMGWRFPWASSFGSDFNFDFHVSFSEAQLAGSSIEYNYQSVPAVPAEELPGMSVFARDGQGDVFHTYSTYARGLDILLGAYGVMDMTPKGRDESGLPYSMAWVRHHDRYDDTADIPASYAPPPKVASAPCCGS